MTILIGQHFLTKPLIIEKDKYSYAGIAYPSVESKFISNKTTYNLAMKPDFFDRYYSIEESIVYVLTKEL